jgi:hypothetical protein
MARKINQAAAINLNHPVAWEQQGLAIASARWP